MLFILKEKKGKPQIAVLRYTDFAFKCWVDINKEKSRKATDNHKGKKNVVHTVWMTVFYD